MKRTKIKILNRGLGVALISIVAIGGWISTLVAEQHKPSDADKIPGIEVPLTPKNLYKTSCAACHGPGGRGARQSQVAFDQALPDFTDCNFATREANLDWVAVAQEGGPARAFSKLMPAFGDALTAEQTEAAVNHIRTFCGNKEWPRGELNLPRPLFTTKAFPEDEIVVSSTIDTSGLNALGFDYIYEKRFGARNQAEIIVPFLWREAEKEDGGQDWQSSVGDIGLALKRVIYHDLNAGSIVSIGGEVLLPTADYDQGFGNGTTVFEPYISIGQILPAQFFIHAQTGAGLPVDTDRANEEIFWRMATGRAFYENGGYGRRWAPMIEVLGSREMVAGADTNWDIVPQLQVTLTQRQHLRLGAGVKVPLNNTKRRDEVYSVYLLWDWFDGGFFEGW